MESALITLLLSNAGVVAVLGNRIHWGRKPQATAAKPYATLQVITELPAYHSRGPSGLVSTRVQIDVYGETYTSVLAATPAIISLLSGYAAAPFQGIFLDGKRDLPAADAGEVSNLFRTSLDFIIWHD